MGMVFVSGDVALLRTENAESWKLEKILGGSHTDVVRSVLWDEEECHLSLLSSFFVPSPRFPLHLHHKSARC